MFLLYSSFERVFWDWNDEVSPYRLSVVAVTGWLGPQLFQRPKRFQSYSLLVHAGDGFGSCLKVRQVWIHFVLHFRLFLFYTALTYFSVYYIVYGMYLLHQLRIHYHLAIDVNLLLISCTRVESGTKWTLRQKVERLVPKWTVMDDNRRSWAKADGHLYESGRSKSIKLWTV